jgi:hypothetical protein
MIVSLKIKNTFLLLLIFLVTDKLNAQFGQQPPYTISIEPAGRLAQGFHSFAFAQDNNFLLLIGGRTNGLHGMSSNDGFPVQYANNDIIVIDTTSWQQFSSSLNVLPYNIADPLRSTNMLYYVSGNYLYMIGGYGWDSIQNRFVTFNTLTAIHINDMVNAVLSNNPIQPHIRQITDTNFTVCGGELKKIYNDYYLCYGHNFEGRYTDPPTPLFTQLYNNEIKKFNITDNGVSISVSNFSYFIDTNEFHRRDLNVCPTITPQNQQGLVTLGGVFRKDYNLPFLNPIQIAPTGGTVINFQQLMNHYTCANISVYDSATQKMYVTLLGGISMYDYNPQNNTAVLDSLVPFVSDISTITINANGQFGESVMPLQMPGLLGSNAAFIPNLNLMSYQNGVIKFRQLPSQPTLAGYILGGIRATGTNLFPSTANDTVYRLIITPDLLSSNVNDENNTSFTIFPNPAQNQINISISSSKQCVLKYAVFNASGEKVLESDSESFSAGNHIRKLNTELSSGVYFIEFKTNTSVSVKKLIVVSQ